MSASSRKDPTPVAPDTVILAAMRASGASGASGAELAKQLGVSRAAIWARIEELRKLGYDLGASPHHGYVLRGCPDALHADDLHARLGQSQVVGREIRVLKETNSTSDVVDKLAHDGVAEGVVVFAESQTQGRGRLGRRWLSPPGKGLWYSVLLRPNLSPLAATQLTVISAVAVARAIERETGLRPGIKWPNDIMFGNRKCAGILIELSTDIDHIRHAVLGIGVDVNLAPADFPAELRDVATSLRAEAGQDVDRPALAAAMLRELDYVYARLREGDFHQVGDEWMRRCSTLGRRVTLKIGDRTVQGVAEALDDEGALVVRNDHGHVERILGGDVTMQR
jgi:BirA family biotin operon repressor/biotin-[acetyl-CoA-carboxylase] ligase